MKRDIFLRLKDGSELNFETAVIKVFPCFVTIKHPSLAEIRVLKEDIDIFLEQKFVIIDNR